MHNANASSANGLSPAHAASAAFVIDPAYCALRPHPAGDTAQDWLFPHGEYEAFHLAKMLHVTKQLQMRVGYPGFFRTPAATAWFRHGCPDGRVPKFEANGEMTILSNGANGLFLAKVTVADTNQSIPALKSSSNAWEASSDGQQFSPAMRGSSPTGELQFRINVELTELQNGLYDAGREVLAEIEFISKNKPKFTCGESTREALLVTKENAEQSFELVQNSPGHWRTPLPLAFRYINAKSQECGKPRIYAMFSPIQYRGAFAADEELTRIWISSAYTLRLCTNFFHIDGIKRDRLPWAGDLAISLSANAYVFNEPEPVKRTLRLLGRDPDKSYVNGICTYSLWLVICHDLFQRYFGDLDFLAESYATITQIIESFIARHDSDGGFMKPKDDEWIFIDWLQMPQTVSMEMIFHWALLSAAKLAVRMGDSQKNAKYCKYAASLQQRLISQTYDEEKGLFRSDSFDKSAPFVRHANFLAILAKVADTAMAIRIAENLVKNDLPKCGSPYMAACEIAALDAAGFKHEAIGRIREIWGGMLKLGATTFWEGYEENCTKEQLTVFYGRPFGKSLCHAWSAAPVALLPQIIFNAHPVADGKIVYDKSDKPFVPNALLQLP